MKEISEIVNIVAGIFTIGASSIAIYLFFLKKKEIKTLFDTLVNYTNHISLSELKEKLERLNEYNARDESDLEKIVIIFNELMGQIRGNEKLKRHLSSQLVHIESMLSDRRRLTEPKKRAIISELREKLRHLNVHNIDEFVGGNE